jgi:hypothetical protein
MNAAMTIKAELSGIAQSVQDSVKASAVSQESFGQVSARINATDGFIARISSAMEVQKGSRPVKR